MDCAILKIKKDLALPADCDLQAKLHNLLVYEKGHHFKPHQDSEKTDGMLGTLVVLLTSSYSGGDFVLDHLGKKKVFKTSVGRGLQFLAFYADCQHQVKKVTKGFRVAFTYNLVFKQSEIGIETQSVRQLTEAVQSYFHDEKVNRFVYLLDHQYTKAGISWNFLNGADRNRVAALLGAADELGLSAGLALAELHETWDVAEEEYNHWGKDWEDDNDDDCDDEEDEFLDSDDDKYSRRTKSTKSHNEYELQDLIDSDTSFEMVMTRNGKRKKECFDVQDNEICFTKPTEDFDPFESEYEGFMGNYGNTLDRWYRRAALVLERKKQKK